MFTERVEGKSMQSIVRSYAGVPLLGNDYYLVPNKGSDMFYDSLRSKGVSDSKIFTTIAAGYNALKSGSGDTLFVCPGSYTISASLTWAKHYTNLVGLGAPVNVNQRSRITNTSASISPLVTWSANGCLVDNIMFSQEGSHATTAAINMYLTGARNKFTHMTLRNLGALAVVDNSCRTLKIDSSDAENHFEDGTIGADTVDGVTATNFVIEFANTNLGNQRQIFRRMNILGNGSANSSWVKANTANCINGSWILFDRCLFSNPLFGDFDQMTQGFAVTASSNGLIYMMDNLIDGCATLETSNSGVLMGRNAYAAATTDIAIALTF